MNETITTRRAVAVPGVGVRAIPAHWWPYIGLGALYLWIAATLRMSPAGGAGDWKCFIDVADAVLRGDLAIYRLRFIWPEYCYAYPVGPLLLMLPFRAVGQALGLSQQVQQFTAVIPYLAGDILCAWLMVDLIGQFKKLEQDARLFLVLLFLGSTMVYFSAAYEGHFETLQVALILLAVRALRADKLIPAAIWLGLALLMKQTAAVVIIPVLLVAWQTRGMFMATRMAVAIVSVFGIVMMPFVIVDPEGVLYMLSGLPKFIGYEWQTSWALFQGNEFAAWLMEYLRPHVNLIILVVVARWSWLGAKRQRIEFNDVRFLALCAGAAVLMILLSKWGASRYNILPLVFLLSYEFTSVRYPLVSISFIAILSNLGLSRVYTTINVPFSAPMAAAQIALLVWVLWWLHQKMSKSSNLPQPI